MNLLGTVLFLRMGWVQAYHPSRIHRDCPGLELTALVADEILTGTLSVPVCEFSKKREKISKKNLIPKLNSHFSKNLSLSSSE
jgi:hypothetical protein